MKKQVTGFFFLMFSIASIGGQETVPDSVMNELRIGTKSTAFQFNPEGLESVHLVVGDDYSEAENQLAILSERYVMVLPQLQDGRIFWDSELPENWTVTPMIFDRDNGDYLTSEEVETSVSFNSNQNSFQGQKGLVKIEATASFSANGGEQDKVVFRMLDYVYIRNDNRETLTVADVYETIPEIRDIPLEIIRVTVVMKVNYLKKMEYRRFLGEFWEKLGRAQIRTQKAIFISLWSLNDDGSEGYVIKGLKEITAFNRDYNDATLEFWSEIDKQFFDEEYSPPLDMNIFDSIRKMYGYVDNKTGNSDNKIARNANYVMVFNDFAEYEASSDDLAKKLDGYADLNIGVMRIDVVPHMSDYYINEEIGDLDKDFYMMDLWYGNQDFVDMLVYRTLCNVAYKKRITKEEKIVLPTRISAAFWHGRTDGLE